MPVISLGGLAACVTVGALGAAAFVLSAPAKADPVVPVSVVCQSLHAGAGIDSVIDQFVDHGYTGEETADIIIGAVRYVCPDEMPTLQAWRVQHSGTTAI